MKFLLLCGLAGAMAIFGSTAHAQTAAPTVTSATARAEIQKATDALDDALAKP